MKHLTVLISLLLGIALGNVSCQKQTLSGDMEKNFVNPPESAKPGVYWYFLDGNLSAKEMTADLE